MATWLVTGAAGFLGSNLGVRLRGHATTVGISRSPCPSYERQMLGDLSDTSFLHEAIAECRPDVVVHTAALANHGACESDPALAERINVDVARAVASAAADSGSRFILISTDAVFDGGQGDYQESDVPNPFSAYGMSKLRGELAVQEVHPSPLIARTNFFGWSPSGRRSILEFFLNALGTGIQVPGFTDFTVTSLYAQHLCEILVELDALEFHGILHIASSDALSKYDFGVAVARQFELDAGLITPTTSRGGPDGVSRARNLSLNAQQVSALLGRAMPSQAEGIDFAYRDSLLRAELAQYP